MSGGLRSLRREVAKNRLKKMGVTHINKSNAFHDNWYDLSAPDFLKRMQNKTKEAK